MRNIKKIIILASAIMLSACEKQDSHVPVPTSNIPQLISIQGSTLRLKATDSPILVESETILTEDHTIVPDGIPFRLVADTIQISNDLNIWQSELAITSVNGKIKFYIKPHTVAGLYRVNAYPVENSTIKFDQGVNARFFVNIVAGSPFSLGLVKTEFFEDAVPYNLAKDILEPWLINANPDTVSYITVGPISDRYGNLLNDGSILLNVSQGSIISEVSTRVLSGYSYFSYKSDGELGLFTATAQLTYDSEIVLTKNELMKKASPQLAFIDNPDFTGMTSGITKCQTIRLRNLGSMIATNLELSSTFPFQLIDQAISDPLCVITSDTCQLHQSLRSGEVCKVRIKFTQPSTTIADGELIAQMAPQEFAGALAIQKLRTQSVQAAQLISSNPFISFGGTQCASSRTVDVVIQNTGDFDAVGITVQNPPPNTNQTNSFYTIILPPADASPSSNLNTVINCGTTFPSNRKCRVQVKFDPTSGIVNQALIGRILGTNINPLMLTVSGYTVPGQALNTFPLSFVTPNNSILPLGMFIQSNQQSRIDVGPVVDACNQLVSDGSILTASVTAGSLLSPTIVTNNGFGSFYWNSSSSSVDLGNQSITVSVGSGGTKSGPLLFRGVALNLTGLTEFNQVIEGKSKTIILTLRNDGNLTASNLSFQTFSPLVITDKGTCNSGSLGAGNSCNLTIKADPIGLNQDMTIPINIQSSTLGKNTNSLSMTLQARTKAILTLDKYLYLFNDGISAPSYQKIIILTNNGPAISYDTSYVVESPFTVQSSSCISTLNVGSSCSIVVNLNASDAALALDKKIKISNEIDTDSPIATLGYSSFRFNQAGVKSIIGRCSEALTISMIGSSGIFNSSSNINITLGSNGGSAFYSSSTCTLGTEITQTQISNGNSVSSNFYVKSNIVGFDLLSASNGAISSGFLTAQFNSELNLTLPSPNGLVSSEIFTLTYIGGYPPLSIAFVDGSRISTEANIISLLDVNENPTGEKNITVKTISSVSTKIIRVTDSLNFTKDFTINLYPPIYMSSTVQDVRGYSPVLIAHSDYGNPNAKTFKIQQYVNGSFVDGSSYGSTVDASGYYTPGNSVPTNTTEYVTVSVAKVTGGFSIARTQLLLNLEWPFGTLGDLIIENGQSVTLNTAQSYDYNSIWVKSGGYLYIGQVSGKESEPVYLGSVKDIKFDGAVVFRLYYPEDGGVRSYTAPDNKSMSYQNVLSRGGYGGSPQCGYATGGGGGAPFGAGGGSQLSNGFVTGPNGAYASSYYGGAAYPVRSPWTCSAEYITDWLNYTSTPTGRYTSTFVGGIGGNAGLNGGNLYLKSHGQILGTGYLDMNGAGGSTGGSASWSNCNPNSGVTPNATGRGGGGGGGGNGGRLFYRSSNIISTFTIYVGAGGGGGPGGSPYTARCTIGGGYYPTGGSNGYSGLIQKIP